MYFNLPSVVTLLLLVVTTTALGTLPTLRVGPQPEQIHLALGDEPSEMIIQWITWQDIPKSFVKYGIESDKFVFNTSAVITTYSYSKWPGFVHTARLTGLRPSTRYYYICGSLAAWSPEFSFRTLDPNAKSHSVIVMGDMSVDRQSDQTVAALIEAADTNNYEFVIHMGDIAYTYDAPDVNQSRFDAYMNKIQPFASKLPYMVAAGNQEFPWLFAEYTNRFRMPFAKSGSTSNLWYSYNVGSMHYVKISTEHHFNPGSPQYDWLVADLQKANENRDKQPWIIVFGHRPFYCSNSVTDLSGWKDCYIVAPGIRLLLEPVFKKYSVDAYINGHMHDSEYTLPLYDSQITSTSFVNPPSPIYVISGYAGSGEGFDTFDNETTFPWSVWRQDSRFGFMNMVYNATHIHFMYLYSDDSKVHHDFYLIKSANAKAEPVKELPKLGAIAKRNMAYVEDVGNNVRAILMEKMQNPAKLRAFTLGPNDLKKFVIGIGIGLVFEFGHIPECIADSYTLYYDFDIAFSLLERGFYSFNVTVLSMGFRALDAALNNLVGLIEDCGGFYGLESLAKILDDFEKYGSLYIAEEELRKIIANFPTLSVKMSNTISYWNRRLYQQSGVELGIVIGIMVKPLNPLP